MRHKAWPKSALMGLAVFGMSGCASTPLKVKVKYTSLLDVSPIAQISGANRVLVTPVSDAREIPHSIGDFSGRELLAVNDVPELVTSAFIDTLLKLGYSAQRAETATSDVVQVPDGFDAMLQARVKRYWYETNTGWSHVYCKASVVLEYRILHKGAAAAWRQLEGESSTEPSITYAAEARVFLDRALQQCMRQFIKNRQAVVQEGL